MECVPTEIGYLKRRAVADELGVSVKKMGGRKKKRKIGHQEGHWYTSGTTRKSDREEDGVSGTGCGEIPGFLSRGEEALRQCTGADAVMVYRKMARELYSFNKKLREAEQDEKIVRSRFSEVRRAYKCPDIKKACSQDVVEKLDNMVLWLSRHSVYMADMLRILLIELHDRDSPDEVWQCVLTDKYHCLSRHFFWPWNGELNPYNVPSELSSNADLWGVLQAVRSRFLSKEYRYPVSFKFRTINLFRESLQSMTNVLLGNVKSMVQGKYWGRVFDYALCLARERNLVTVKVSNMRGMSGMLLLDADGGEICDMTTLRQKFKTGASTGNETMDWCIRRARHIGCVTPTMKWSVPVKVAGKHVRAHTIMNRFFDSMEDAAGVGWKIRQRTAGLLQTNLMDQVPIFRSVREFKDSPELDYNRKTISFGVRHQNNTAGLPPSWFLVDSVYRREKSISTHGMVRKRPVRVVKRAHRRRGMLVSISTNGVDINFNYASIVEHDQSSGESPRESIDKCLFVGNDKGRVNLDQFEVWCGSTLPDRAPVHEQKESKAMSMTLEKDRYQNMSGETELLKKNLKFRRRFVIGDGRTLEQFYTDLAETVAPRSYDMWDSLARSLDRQSEFEKIHCVVESGVYERMRRDRAAKMRSFLSAEYGYLARMAIQRDRRLVIFDGTVGFAASGKGESAVPTTSRAKILRNVLKSYSELRWTIVPTSEHNTTKLHHRCLQETHPWKVRGKNCRDLRWCSTCKSRFSRDRNAARNILCIGISQWCGLNPPPQFNISASEAEWVQAVNERLGPSAVI